MDESTTSSRLATLLEVLSAITAVGVLLSAIVYSMIFATQGLPYLSVASFSDILRDGISFLCKAIILCLGFLIIQIVFSNSVIRSVSLIYRLSKNIKIIRKLDNRKKLEFIIHNILPDESIFISIFEIVGAALAIGLFATSISMGYIDDIGQIYGGLFGRAAKSLEDILAIVYFGLAPLLLISLDALLIKSKKITTRYEIRQVSSIILASTAFAFGIAAIGLDAAGDLKTGIGVSFISKDKSDECPDSVIVWLGEHRSLLRCGDGHYVLSAAPSK